MAFMQYRTQTVYFNVIPLTPHCTTHDIEFFTTHISVSLSDRSKITQSKINFVKNCPQWGWNSQPPDYQSHALPTVLGEESVGDF